MTKRKPPDQLQPKRTMSKAATIAAAATKVRDAQQELDRLMGVERFSESGRVTIYKPEFDVRAEDMALLGLTNEEIGERLGATAQSITRWEREVTSFREALYRGREGADTNVARALYKAAIGFEHPEDDIRTVSMGGNAGSEIVITPTTKRYPPNYSAGSLWLSLRQRRRWPVGSLDPDKRPPEEMARAAQEAIAAALATDDSSTTTSPKENES